jgi:hypothetical protein
MLVLSSRSFSTLSVSFQFTFSNTPRPLGYSNLANREYGAALPKFFKKWTLDECALLGAKLLQIAYETLKQSDLSSRNRITWNRGRGRRCFLQYSIVSLFPDPEFYSKKAGFVLEFNYSCVPGFGFV